MQEGKAKNKEDEEKTVKLCLIVEVEYNANGVPRKFLEGLIMGAVEREVGNGMLTGDTAAEVEHWKAYVSPFCRDFGDLDKVNRDKQTLDVPSDVQEKVG